MALLDEMEPDLTWPEGHESPTIPTPLAVLEEIQATHGLYSKLADVGGEESGGVMAAAGSYAGILFCMGCLPPHEIRKRRQIYRTLAELVRLHLIGTPRLFAQEIMDGPFQHFVTALGETNDPDLTRAAGILGKTFVTMQDSPRMVA
jgi:hypothetical protein